MFFQEKNFVRNLEFWFGFGYLNRENTSTCLIQPSNDVREKKKTTNVAGSVDKAVFPQFKIFKSSTHFIL